jgi:hypothetical protein
VRVAFAWSNDGFRRLAGPAARRFHRAEARARERGLEAARAGLDVELAYRLAVERALSVRERGGAMPAQVAAYDDALLGLVLTEPQARGVAEARARIAAGWP